MITVLILMTLGIVIGWFIHKKENILKFVSKLTNLSIFLLLFLLGLSVGTNDQIIKNFDQIGLLAITITVFAVLGSVLVSWLTYILFFKKNER